MENIELVVKLYSQTKDMLLLSELEKHGLVSQELGDNVDEKGTGVQPESIVSSPKRPEVGQVPTTLDGS
jgi:hypothetical protein